MGVKNKFCSTCARTKNGDKPKNHTCFKNWKTSDGSSGMEASIIVEGFKESEQVHGIRYHKFIADGDSNVYKRILDSRLYKNLTIQKVECRNHLLRNLCKKLRDMCPKRDAGKLLHRKLLQNNILRIRKGIVTAIKYRKENKHSEIDLQNDILNCVDHVFGQHTKCAAYFCETVNDTNITNAQCTNFTEKIKATDPNFYSTIMKHIRYLARHSRSLIENVDSNVVESLNGIIAKLIGGKRVNCAMSGSYQGRCSAATVIKNTKRPLYTLHKVLLHRSPNKKCPSSILELNRLKKRNRQNELRQKTYRKKLKYVNDSADPSYGNNAQKPDMTENEYEEEKKFFLNNLKIIADNRINIERETVDQTNSTKWFELRRNIITASNFGRIIALRPDTGCEGVLKSLLYSTNLDTKALEYGREHEYQAKRDLELALEVEINDCGLFIDSIDVFLGATPDGLIGEDTLVEIKCPYSAENLDPDEAIIQKKITIWKTNKNKEITGIDRNHKYYYQVQGQLHITKRKYGIIACWTRKGIKYEKIERDDTLWQTKMFPKLNDFFFQLFITGVSRSKTPKINAYSKSKQYTGSETEKERTENE